MTAIYLPESELQDFSHAHFLLALGLSVEEHRKLLTMAAKLDFDLLQQLGILADFRIGFLKASEHIDNVTCFVAVSSRLDLLKMIYSQSFCSHFDHNESLTCQCDRRTCPRRKCPQQVCCWVSSCAACETRYCAVLPIC